MASSCGCVRKVVAQSSLGDGGRGASGSRPDSARGAGDAKRPVGPDARGYRFDRSLRLTSRRQFQAVYENGLKAASPCFVVFGLRNGLDHSRLGLTLTRRYGGAVARNRAKRRLREVFRLNRHRFPLPMDLVVNGRRALADRPLPVIERELVECIERLARRLSR